MCFPCQTSWLMYDVQTRIPVLLFASFYFCFYPRDCFKLFFISFTCYSIFFLFPWLKTKCSALMRKESKLYFWVNTTSWLHWVTALSREFSLSFDIQIANLKQLHALKKTQMVMYTEYLISKLNSTSRTIAKATVTADKITAKMVSKDSRFHLSAGSLAMALVWRICCHGAKQVCETWNIFLAFRSTNT